MINIQSFIFIMAAAATSSSGRGHEGSLEAIVSDEYVICECVRDGSRLRVRITSPGYYHDANCMFPRDLRAAGRKFRVRRSNIRLIMTRSKYYYTTGSRDGIELLPETVTTSDLKIYEDTESIECAICFANPKEVIVNPCGHFYMCTECARNMRACPICRERIIGLIHKSMMM